MKSSYNNSKIWFVGELFNVLKKFFSEKEIDAPRKTAELIFSNVLNLKNSSFLYISFDKPLLQTDVDVIRNMAKRRINGEPIEYITNMVDFYGEKFKIDSRGLIPRPETEIIVDKYFEYSTKEQLDVLDLCSGSGVIGLTIKRLRTDVKLVLSDISIDALALSRENSEFLGLDATFILSDGLEKHPDNSYDIIVSNPPYIKSDVIASLQKEVKDYEPVLALDGGNDGLEFYIAQFENFYRALKKDSLLFLEYGGFEQTKEILKLYEKKFKILEVVKDFNNIDRILVLKKY